MSLACVRLENLGRAVDRVVVHRDHEVDPGIQVERQHRVDDVLLIAEKERHHDLHDGLTAMRAV